ncbi:hypothetical protein [Corynebacterium aquilae]|uniref:Uncharacterized protein n=1 Tax=Corynebacterium aquilae DSM 44791 TaxID=1431546 RepID=A0A1L7CH75_9CORY|nr:hypothetical protein [Corynebacterium aquilae]APT85184.1 hypothetical protein CAQU_08995 [Corynebacterium aquilae DSM 44791]
MSTTTSWTPRTIEGSTQKLDLLAGETTIGHFTETDKGHTVEAVVYDQPWHVTRDDMAVTATLQDGRTYALTGDKGRIGGSKRLDVDLAGHAVACINEAKQDWVIEDTDGTKLGQFSGGNRGVRSSLVEWEDDATEHLNREEQAFLSYAARIALESRLWRNTWILTASLLVLAPIIILIYLYGPVF